MPTSSATKARKPASRPKPRGAGKGWRRETQALWPLLICLALDPFLVRAASIVVLTGPKNFTLFYPSVEFLHLPIFHFTAERLSTLTQWALYLQFPVYGLLMTLAYRADKKLRAFVVGLVAHFGSVGLVVLLAYLRP